ncbi:MAG: SDR family NAD(P)-dependent oxidoreductase [Pseudomonadota bacterium]
MASIEFDNRVAIITGAGAGLGRSHAIALARRGVRVVASDIQSPDSVCDEIAALGGEAIAIAANVTDPAAVTTMVEKTIDRWGHIDILVNNAGILRDRSFAKMTLDEWRAVIDVHLTGSAICTHAVWQHMRERQYGRIVFTSSSSGLYGNFGQANYGAAKMGVIGLMNVLHLEGIAKGIHVNALSPVAATQMTEGLMPEEALAKLTPDSVSEGLVYLCCDAAPARLILCAGAGSYGATRIFGTQGITLDERDRTAEQVAARIADVVDSADQEETVAGGEQTVRFLAQAGVEITR